MKIPDSSLTLEKHRGFSASGIMEILDLAKEMCAKTLQEELKQTKIPRASTHGEILYKEYKKRGIKGEVIDGFPVVRTTTLPMLKHYMKKGNVENDVAVQVLLYSMRGLGDTNIVSRGEMSALDWMQKTATGILALGGVFTEVGRMEIREMNQRCIEKNISPGGSADMLALTIFLWELENEKVWNLKMVKSNSIAVPA